MRKGGGYSPQVEVDARNLLCPLPVLRVASAMEELAVGAVLRIRATDPGLSRDLPAWCTVNGHRLLQMDRQGSEWIGLVCKGMGSGGSGPGERGSS
ncbi:MAG: sulfurtransferase TusA family protein [Magnetococcales bacterium]|nr:sulfurtransferase TusA family protein [Magnetococcales bacterium]